MSGGQDAALAAAEAGAPPSAAAAKATPAPAAGDRPGRFKVVARLIMAMKRFEAALNPTYTYGKRPDTPPHPGAVGGAAPGTSPVGGLGGRAGGTPPPAIPPGPPGGAAWVPAADADAHLPTEVHPARKKGALPTYVHHGHRASLLSARLPSVGDVTAAAGSPEK